MPSGSGPRPHQPLPAIHSNKYRPPDVLATTQHLQSCTCASARPESRPPAYQQHAAAGPADSGRSYWCVVIITRIILMEPCPCGPTHAVAWGASAHWNGTAPILWTWAIILRRRPRPGLFGRSNVTTCCRCICSLTYDTTFHVNHFLGRYILHLSLMESPSRLILAVMMSLPSVHVSSSNKDICNIEQYRDVRSFKAHRVPAR
jgi:hypothetical protein